MENLEIALTFTVAELNSILKGLSELAFKEALPLVNKIQSTAQAAVAAEAEKLKAPPEAEPVAEAA